jgi:hypothetical protein
MIEGYVVEHVHMLQWVNTKLLLLPSTVRLQILHIYLHQRIDAYYWNRYNVREPCAHDMLRFVRVIVPCVLRCMLTCADRLMRSVICDVCMSVDLMSC